MLEAVKHTLLLAGVRTVDLSGNLGGKNRRLHFSRCLAAPQKTFPDFVKRTMPIIKTLIILQLLLMKHIFNFNCFYI